jgi:hypothetical protein
MVDLRLNALGIATIAKNLVKCWIGAASVAERGAAIGSCWEGRMRVLVAGVWMGCYSLGERFGDAG